MNYNGVFRKFHQLAASPGAPHPGYSISEDRSDGDIQALLGAPENGCPWNERTCQVAACNGQLDCLKYLHENGCPWNQDTCLWAEKYGHLDCLKYAYEHGCPWNVSEDVKKASLQGQLLHELPFLGVTEDV